MAKPELGTKRVDPETGKKFYDLNRDPIISPYTNISYPRSYFETAAEATEVEDESSEDVLDTVLEKPTFVSLDDSESDTKADDLPDLGDDDVDLDDEDDAFLPDEDEDEDMSGFIGTNIATDPDH